MRGFFHYIVLSYLAMLIGCHGGYQRPQEARVPANISSVLICAPLADWQYVDAGPFSFSIPNSMKKIDTQGVDTYVGRYEDDSLRLTFDFDEEGTYTGSPHGRPNRTSEWVLIDGRKAEIVTMDFEESNAEFSKIVATHFPKVYRDKRTKLTIWALCRDDAARESARLVFGTIRFVEKDKRD